jgi:hypothetical protein
MRPLDRLASDLRERLLAEADVAPGADDLTRRVRALVDAEAGVLGAQGREALAARVAEAQCRTGTIAAAAPQVKAAIESYGERYAAAQIVAGGGK